MSRVSIAVAAAVCALTASIATAAAPATGNARAIAFERAAFAVDNHAPGYTLVETGALSMRSVPDSSGGVRFELDWGTGTVPGGWTAAIGSASYALHAGTVAGVDLVVSPAGPGSPDVPIEIVANRSGIFWRRQRRGGCFTRWKVTPSFEAAVGTPLFAASGRFDAAPDRYTTTLTVGSRTETINATTVQRVYGWGVHGQRATELDSFVTATKALFASAISVTADGAGHPGFTIEQEWNAQRRTPAIPATKACG